MSLQNLAKTMVWALRLITLVIDSLTAEIEAAQEEFKSTHKYLDGLKQSGPNASSLKREIQQMEEEKQQILAKIQKIQKKVQTVPKSEQWLQAGKNLRLEQSSEMALADRLREQNSQIAISDKKLATVTANFKAAKVRLYVMTKGKFSD